MMCFMYTRLTSAGVNFQNPDANISTGVGGPCPVGHYCPEGSGLPLPCPLGTFSNRYFIVLHIHVQYLNELDKWMTELKMCLHSLYITANSGCTVCPAGKFCGSVGLSRPSGLCKEGFYCPPGSTSSTGLIIVWSVMSLRHISVCAMVLTVVLWFVQVLILKVVSVPKHTFAQLAVPSLLPALRVLTPTLQGRLSALHAMLDITAQRAPANTCSSPVLLDSTALMVRDQIQ